MSKHSKKRVLVCFQVKINNLDPQEKHRTILSSYDDHILSHNRILTNRGLKAKQKNIASGGPSSLPFFCIRPPLHYGMMIARDVTDCRPSNMDSAGKPELPLWLLRACNARQNDVTAGAQGPETASWYSSSSRLHWEEGCAAQNPNAQPQLCCVFI